MINNKNFIFYFIPYITLTCGIYHYVFWLCFGLNGLSIISTENIINKAIGSLITSSLSSFIAYFILIYFKKVDFEKITDKSQLIRSTTVQLIIYTFTSIAFFFITKKIPFDLISFFASLMIFEWINRDVFFDENYKPLINKNILLLIIINLPLNAISTGLNEANNLKTNKNYLYSFIKKNKSSNTQDTLKLINSNNDTFIFTNMKNDKFYFIKSDSIELFYHKQKN